MEKRKPQIVVSVLSRFTLYMGLLTLYLFQLYDVGRCYSTDRLSLYTQVLSVLFRLEVLKPVEIWLGPVLGISLLRLRTVQLLLPQLAMTLQTSLDFVLLRFSLTHRL